MIRDPGQDSGGRWKGQACVADRSEQQQKHTAVFHLPGLFEDLELYRHFLPLFYSHREYFYDWCTIGSLYGAPAGCLWGGGRVGEGNVSARDVLSLTESYGISARLTFSNLLLTPSHLSDPFCNRLCEIFSEGSGRNGVITGSDLLTTYLSEHYPKLYLISSTTKVLTHFQDLKSEIQRPEYTFVVPDFRLNRDFKDLETLSRPEKEKVEFLVNECCDFGCSQRKACYEAVSRECLGEVGAEAAHRCPSKHAGEGYVFSRAMENPGFISREDIRDVYLPMGFSDFKIEGRGLGSALILEFLLYYLTKPECQLKVREAIYLGNELDLF